MSIIDHIYARIYQNILRFAAYFAPFPEPTLVEGNGSLSQLPDLVKQAGIQRLFLLTYGRFQNSLKFEPLMKAFSEQGIQITLFNKVPADPPIQTVEATVLEYQKADCQGICAIGGGSPMDVAKALGARIGNPDLTLMEMKGFLKIRKPIPPLFLIPTTAGTGSEATLCSVLTDVEKKQKFFLIDAKIVPKIAILDPELTVDLPPTVTAATGMDALTHAVEAFLGHSNTTQTSQKAAEAVALVFHNLQPACQNGSDLEARKAMQKAAFLAGEAFTRAYLGYVHAITHNLGCFYHIPHGEANAVFLPLVLKFYGRKAWKRLAKLADATGIGNSTDSVQTKAETFITAIQNLSKSIGMRERLPGLLKKADLPILVDRAFNEAYPSAPVPRFMSRKDIENLILEVM